MPSGRLHSIIFIRIGFVFDYISPNLSLEILSKIDNLIRLVVIGQNKSLDISFAIQATVRILTTWATPR